MDDLRKLAEAASKPGCWSWDADSVKGDPMGRYRARVVTTGRTITQSYYTDEQGHKDAAYIAACSPDRILKLLDALDAALEQLELVDPNNGATDTIRAALSGAGTRTASDE